jgi:hypothetical protein
MLVFRAKSTRTNNRWIIIKIIKISQSIKGITARICHFWNFHLPPQISHPNMPGQQSQRNPVHRRQFDSSQNDVVPIKKLELFNRICLRRLEQRRIAPTTTPIPILGTRPLDTGSRDRIAHSRRTYLARLRKLVVFLMKNTQYHDSLLVFYPYTPKGMACCEDKAILDFLLCAYTPKGKTVMDMHRDPLVDTSTQAPYTGIGCWNSTCAMDGLISALDHVHSNAHGLHTYVEAYSQCVDVLNRPRQ